MSTKSDDIIVSHIIPRKQYDNDGEKLWEEECQTYARNNDDGEEEEKQTFQRQKAETTTTTTTTT
eukprot:CAMPEP_0196149986 /NCGR_PEP_ID=MMETSP0910-20130528/30921_1 /TAXON_ID=49265 /ORGANISM="Thalassiosira rotula, Strain GSO102" /LENGTH=64 /DNA_ID=CAMNT_0041413015 /DNA_START=102 /DNA_END=292 /DNA_ORIENTATION=-